MSICPIMQIHLTVSEVLWKSYISVCISGFLYGIAGISSYDHGILYICSKFVWLYGSFSTHSFYSSSVFCFNFDKVGTSLNFSWNVFWMVSTSVSVREWSFAGFIDVVIIIYKKIAMYQFMHYTVSFPKLAA